MKTTSMLTVRTSRAHVAWTRGVASCLIAALLMAGVPTTAMAKWRDYSGHLPGTTSNNTAIAVAAIGGAAVVALVIVAKKKGGKEAAFDVEAPKFAKGSDQAAANASIINNSKAPITVKQLSLEADGGWSLTDGPRVPFTVGPGERLDVTVNYDPAAGGSTRAHLRVVASAPGKKEAARVVSFSRPDGEPDAGSCPVQEGIILPQR